MSRPSFCFGIYSLINSGEGGSEYIRCLSGRVNADCSWIRNGSRESAATHHSSVVEWNRDRQLAGDTLRAQDSSRRRDLRRRKSAPRHDIGRHAGNLLQEIWIAERDDDRTLTPCCQTLDKLGKRLWG